MTTRVKIYEADNKQWSFKVYRGGNIVLTPHETYSTRENVRRALLSLHKISCSEGADLRGNTELACAIFHELQREKREYAFKVKKAAKPVTKKQRAMPMPVEPLAGQGQKFPVGGW